MYEPSQVLKNRYQLQKRLGRTAAGRQTWLASDLTAPSTEAVIVKLLAFGLQMEWQEFELFEREARILQTLNYPYIPRYRDYFALDRQESGDVPWFALVQDYIPGSSLQDLLDQGTHFTQPQVRQIAEGLLAILQYLHELSPPVLHRDIKPSNVILGTDQKSYLVDFGAVQEKAGTTGVSFTVVGTSGYAPLEQFYGRAIPASDLYALGATLIHLLTGITPSDLIQNDGTLAFIERVNLNPAILPPDWLQQLTALDLSKRFKSAREAWAALRAADRLLHQQSQKRRSEPVQRSPVDSYAQTVNYEREGDRNRIARLELENELLRIDRDWDNEQEQYKVRYSKNSAPRLPTLTDTIVSVVFSVIILVIISSMITSVGFMGSGGSWILILVLPVLIGQCAYQIWQYNVYKRAYQFYQQRRASAIDRYEQKH